MGSALAGDGQREALRPRGEVALDASSSQDPDGDKLIFEWSYYPAAGSYQGVLPALHSASSPQTTFIAPEVQDTKMIHLLLAVTDNGTPALTRYGRVIVTVDPTAK